MPVQSQANLQRLLLLALLVLPLVGVIWFFGPVPGPSKPSGRLGEAFEAELLAGLSAVGVTGSTVCSMVSKSSVVAVTCRTPQSSVSTIADQFVSRGWIREGTSTMQTVILKRPPDTLTIETPNNGETSVGIMRAFP